MLIKEREKITKGITEVLKIMDRGSFVEIGAKACGKETSVYSPDAVCGSDGVVTGYGTVDGKAVFLFCQDEDVMGGTMGAVHAGKIRRIYSMAQKTGVPVIGIVNSRGFRIEEAADGLEAFGDLYREALKAKETVLQIIIKDTNSTGAMTALAETADFTLEAGKQDNSKVVRQLLDILPPSKRIKQEPGEVKDDLNRLCVDIEENGGNPMEFLKEISDDGFVLEYKADMGMRTVTAFIRLAGRTVGAVMGISGQDEASLMDAQAVEKAAQFVKLCSSLNIGILTTGSNCGVGAEAAKEPRMIRAICELSANLANANVPKISLLAGEWAGLGYILMGSKAFAMDMVFAWPSAKVMMINSNQAVSVLYPGIRPPEVFEKAKEYEQRCCSIDFLLERGYADKARAPEESRKYLIGAFEAFNGAY